MKRFFLSCIASLFLAAPLALAQASPPHGGSRLVVVMPFENASGAPGIDWIGESFPEILDSLLDGPGIFVIARADRLYAFDRMGIPAGSRPSRATLFQVGDQMDVDFVITGKYLFDGTTFTARAQLMDIRRMRLSPEVVEAGALTQLLDIQRALAGDLLRSLNPPAPDAKGSSVPAAPPVPAAPAVRLDALENYIRGVTSGSEPDRLRYFKQAVKIDPQYSEAQFALGRVYFDARDYANAMQALGKVALTHRLANEANFYLGLAAHYAGDYDKAERAFAFTARQVPLIEVYNDLGVAMARRGKKGAADYFQRAAAADPRDADYRFNLAVALYRNGDAAGAQRQLREALVLRPQDAEAKTFLEQLIATGTGTAAAVKAPLERIKRNYDEASYRQLAIEIQNTREQRFAGMPRASHAASHVARGEDLLGQGTHTSQGSQTSGMPSLNLNDEAENEFREAALLDPTNPGAHFGLARILDSRNDIGAARAEAQTALQLKAQGASGVAEIYLLLGSLDVKQNHLESARENADRAAHIDPANPGIAPLRQAIAARQTQTAPSSSQPDAQPKSQPISLTESPS